MCAFGPLDVMLKGREYLVRKAEIAIG